MAIKTIKRDGQNATLLVHLAKGKPLTRLKAFHIYHVANLTARMSDLRDLLFNVILQGQGLDAKSAGIIGTTKTDPNGQPFEEYRIPVREHRQIIGSYLSKLRRAQKRAA